MLLLPGEIHLITRLSNFGKQWLYQYTWQPWRESMKLARLIRGIYSKGGGMIFYIDTHTLHDKTAWWGAPIERDWKISTAHCMCMWSFPAVLSVFPVKTSSKSLIAFASSHHFERDQRRLTHSHNGDIYGSVICGANEIRRSKLYGRKCSVSSRVQGDFDEKWDRSSQSRFGRYGRHAGWTIRSLSHLIAHTWLFLVDV